MRCVASSNENDGFIAIEIFNSGSKNRRAFNAILLLF